MGSSIAFRLASRGLKTLVLEQFDLNHANGSSHGETRIIRTAYDNPYYVPLVQKAVELWQELRETSGDEVIRPTGGLHVGPASGSYISGVLRSVREYGLPYELLSSSESNARFGMLDFGEGRTVLYEKNAGILFPEKCIETYVALGREAGGEYKFREPVTTWKSTKEGIEVETQGDTYLADNLVIAAGPWSAPLLERIVSLRCERQVPFWFNPQTETRFGPDTTPVFIVQENNGDIFYGIPDVGHGVKVARHHGGKSVNPDRVDRNVTEADKRPVSEFVRRVLPGLRPEPSSWTTCVYTNTPDDEFVIDFDPHDDRIVFVSACSGHGFKFASVIGVIAANLVTEGRTEYDISHFRIDRFAQH
jgi:sarcosine oxidase